MQASQLRIATRLLAAIFLLLLTGCSAVRGLELFPANQETVHTEEATLPAPQADAAPTTTPWTTPAASPTPVPSPTLTLLSGQPSIGDPFTPDLGNTGYDVQHYGLELAVDPSESNLSGTVRIEALTTMPNLRQISLDFIGFDISSVTVDDTPASFQRDANKLWVAFPQPLLSEGTPFEIAVQYAGQPEQRDSPYIHYADYLGLIFPGNNQFYTLSEPDGARYWFPANDHPRDKATFRTELTVPRGLAAIANGRLVDSRLSTMPDGSDGATFVWEHDYPMATYLALAAGGHYLRVDEESPGGIPLIYYYFPELEEEYLEAVQVTGEAVDWLSERLGPYPFDSYGQVSYYALGISMEMQTMTLLSFQMLDERTVVHELTHSWIGNWVGLDNWGDTWRKEGLATYMEVLWLSRNDPARLEELIAEIEEEVAERGRDYALNQPPRDRILSFDSYQRGALLIHALHQEIGDDAFFQGLRAYIAEHGGGFASQEAFETAMEEAAGRSLQEFFDSWLAPIESP
ncbi:MAG TPA: M1 family metallopeptidase [Candidatus Sulfomarinibacteraceae bacterium]|nr:M1 family metallopeptidase [Candidatus Sulfomarinibacteraceae bacterium]